MTSGEFELYVSKNGGSYAPVTATSTGGVQSYDASSDADDTAIRVPRLYPFNADFPLSGAAIDLDFANNRIFGASAFIDLFSCSRASIGYSKNTDGRLIQFSADTLRLGSGNGLLVEGARENKLLYSDDLSQTATWAGSPSTSANNTDGQLGPDGQTIVYKVIESSGTSYHAFWQNAGSLGSGAVVTISAFAKANTRSALYLASTTDTTSWFVAAFDLATATVTTTQVGSAASVISSNIEAFADGWYRVSVTGSHTNATYFPTLGLSDVPLPASFSYGTYSYNGDGSSGLFITGIQCEVNSFASSFIPTTTTSATMAADVVTIVGSLQSFIASTSGSIIVQLGNAEGKDFAANIIDSNGTNLLGFDATNHGLASITATLATGNTGNRSLLSDKLGIAWDGSGRSLCLNGGTVVTDATAQTSSSTHLGSSGTDKFAYAYIQRVTVWAATKLADATLQELTTP